MKLYETYTYEMDAEGFLKNRKDIAGYMQSMTSEHGTQKWSIRDANTVDVNGNVTFLNPSFFYDRSRITVRFGEVSGTFSVLSSTDFASFVGFPKKCKKILLRYSKISSLIGFEKVVEELEELEIIDMGDSIKEGGLGLLHIKNLKKINHEVQQSILKIQRPTALEIIAKYVGRPNDIFECQAELIENGFEEYAKI